jgi:hypothetical protein
MTEDPIQNWIDVIRLLGASVTIFVSGLAVGAMIWGNP